MSDDPTATPPDETPPTDAGPDPMPQDAPSADDAAPMEAPAPEAQASEPEAVDAVTATGTEPDPAPLPDPGTAEPSPPATETAAGFADEPGDASTTRVDERAGETEIEGEPEGATGAEAEASLPQDAPTGPRTVGRLVADALRAAGVRYAFTVPGESFLGLLDALGDAGIRVVATRHEGAAAFMAEAHGQLTGRPAACLATRAVGASNLAIGIHTARQDSAPLFALVGQVDRGHLGHEAFQEIDQVATIGGLAKWAAQPSTADEVGSVMREAVRQALTGRPGPVLISLSEDLLDEEAPAEARVDGGRAGPTRASDDDVRAVIELLASARRPVILAGAGVLRARTSTDLLRFASLLQVPIIASWRRADVVSNDDPLYLGMAGLAAPPTVRRRLAEADAMLVVGCRLNELTSFDDAIPAPGTPWIHVDIEPSLHAGITPPQRSVAADARTFLRAANERLVGKAVLDAERVATRQADNAADREAFEAASIVDGDADAWTGPGVHPGRVIATLRRVLPDDAILTTDAGNFAGWAGRGFRFRKPGTFVGPTSGAMGYGLPAAIAAALVHRDRPVVALVGDGGLGMTMAEIETAVREHARVIVLVFDNERYGTIRMWQERRGTGQGIGTELGPVDFAAIARAMGARGVKVERDAELEGALRQAMVEDRPTVIQLTVDRRWVSVDEVAAG
jgi:acetolactate synthase-1/2/3 large subunit